MEVKINKKQTGLTQVPVIDANVLLNGFREVRIQYCREEYRLRLTKNQKLILTK